MKVKLMYHGSDMDGYASGYIMKKYAKDYYPEAEITMIPLIYGVREPMLSDFEDINDDDLVIIADWAFSDNIENLNILNYITNNMLPVMWCDHHDTSIAIEKKYPHIRCIPGVRNKDHSGAYILYSYLYSKGDIPKWLKLVSDYDTFELKLNDSIPFNYGILNCGKHDPSFETSIWDALNSEDKNKRDWALNKTIRHGNQIFRFILADNKRYLMANGFECELNGYKCLACNKISNSFLFESIDKSKYELLCAFVFDGNQYRYSIYSNGSINCAKIASEYGGGGHVGAAGFRSKELILTDMKKLERIKK